MGVHRRLVGDQLSVFSLLIPCSAFVLNLVFLEFPFLEVRLILQQRTFFLNFVIFYFSFSVHPRCYRALARTGLATLEDTRSTVLFMNDSRKGPGHHEGGSEAENVVGKKSPVATQTKLCCFGVLI